MPDGCQVGAGQPPASAIPGNIGIVKAKVMVWDHDPMMARSAQDLSFSFHNDLPIDIQKTIPNLQIENGVAFLKPQYIMHDMFVATFNKVNPPSMAGSTGLDFVGSPESGVGQDARDKMPGGKIYKANGVLDTIEIKQANGTVEKILRGDIRTGRDKFPHQLWIYIGSLLKGGVPVHPSEYNKNLSDAQAAFGLLAQRNGVTFSQGDGVKYTITELQSAPKWDYMLVKRDGVESVCPVMVSKQVPDLTSPVHWTLEKFAPLWRGEDFFVSVIIGDKQPDAAVDPFSADDIVDTNWPEYKYLLYYPATLPDGWQDGVSNEAFAVIEENDQGGLVGNGNLARKQYWWRYKTYILIEIGVGNPDHNYFIDICEGRNPRFLHLGEEWDNIHRPFTNKLDPNDFKFMKKCRVLSECPFVSSDELFKQKNFRVIVRNNLGRLVVTFEGYEDYPWIITRLDNEAVGSEYVKQTVPMIVPSSKMRIHGGNISCAINFSPTSYTPSASVVFADRQIETYSKGNRFSVQDNFYLTFSHMCPFRTGQNSSNQPTLSSSIFGTNSPISKYIGYDCDAAFVTEIHRGSPVDVGIYAKLHGQFGIIGKGYVYSEEKDSKGITKTTQRCWLSKSHTLSLSIQGDISQILTTSTTDADGHVITSPSSQFDVIVKFDAGHIKIPKESYVSNGDIQIDAKPADCFFTNVVTPIATSWRMVVPGDGKVFQGQVNSFDIAPLVNHIHDSWNAEDYSTVNHEMQIRCYIPDVVPTGENPLDNNNVTRTVDQQNLLALGQSLLSLRKQAFYVTVSYWWENGIGMRDVIGSELQRGGKTPGESGLLVAMTGIAYGGSVETSNNKTYMDFTVKDYMSILEKQYILNSPFFDGVSDVSAILELVKMAGFDTNDQITESKINRGPLSYLQKAIKIQEGDGQTKEFNFNGDIVRCKPYDLPGKYADLADPAVRFQNGESYESALKHMAKLSGKTIYFDRFGVLRVENIPTVDAAFAGGKSLVFWPVFDFVTSPLPLSEANPNSELSAYKFTFDPAVHAAHLVYEAVQTSHAVEDCVNQIGITSAGNEIKLPDGSVVGGLIVEGHTFYDQITNPKVEGFLGFKKPFYQSNGVFGDLESVRNTLKSYAKMKYPPFNISFQTYGVPGLKALDIITVNNNLCYITEISHEIDPEQNRWWMNCTGVWLKNFNETLTFANTSFTQIGTTTTTEVAQ